MDLSQLLKDLQGALPAPTKAAAQLPGPSDLSFHRALDRSLHRSLSEHSQRVLALAQSTLDYLNQSCDSENQELDPEMVLEGEYKAVSDALERVIERADESIEYALGIKKLPDTEQQPKQPAKPVREKLDRALYLADIPKPQDRFLDERERKAPELPTYGIDEPFDRPLWKPRHVPDSRLRIVETRQTSTPRNTPFGRPYMAYAHPYSDDIDNLALPTRLLVAPDTDTTEDPKMDQRFDETPYAWVDTLDAFTKMLDEIRACGTRHPKDLAIDVEHHDKRTWRGLTSLVQLSTYEKDYVIDVLDPDVRENAHRLNEFTTSKDWIKVLHGAHRDIIWLQRDLGIYVVGLFDTYYATHSLNLAQHSLASLLDSYTSFVADKKYQMADWRIRPLPAEMANYARSDTHFLLHIFNSLLRAIHNATKQDGFSPVERLRQVWEQSKQVSTKAYSHVPYSSNDLSHNSDLSSLVDRIARDLPSSFVNQERDRPKMVERIARLAHLREDVARRADDSPAYVLPVKAIRALFENATKLESALDVRETLARVVALKPVLGHEERILAAIKYDGPAPPDVQSHSQASIVGTSQLWASSSTSSTSVAVPRAESSKLLFSADSEDSFKRLRTTTSALFPSSVSKGKRKEQQARTANNNDENVQRIHESLLLAGALSSKPKAFVGREQGEGVIDEEQRTDIVPDHAFAKPTAGPSLLNTFGSGKDDPLADSRDKVDLQPIIVSQVSKSSLKKKNKHQDHPSSPQQQPQTSTADDKTSSKKQKTKKKERQAAVPYDPSAQPSILDARPWSKASDKAKSNNGTNNKKDDKKNGNSKKRKSSEPAAQHTPEFKRIRVPNFEKKGSKSKTFS